MNVGHLRSSSTNNVDVNRLTQSAEKISPLGNGRQQIDNGVSGDKLTISQEARELLSADKDLQQRLENLPEFRPEKVELATNRVNNGYYNRESVIGRTADKLIGG
jgi:hypothetical protein